MRTGTYALAAIFAVASTPAAGQIADRTEQSRERRGNAVVVRPGDAGRAGPSRAGRGGDGRGGRGGEARGGRGGGVVIVTPGNRDRVRCEEFRRRHAAGRHGWFDADSRYDCGRDNRYGIGRRQVGLVVRASVARQHTLFMNQLDREHDRWHRTHGWYPRNRGWRRSHEALHRRLERDHERWHRRLGVPFSLWPDGIQHRDVPGRGRGVVVIR